MRGITRIAIVLGLLVAVSTPASAQGAQALGETGTPVDCQDNRPWVPETSIAAYTASNHGVITSWRTMGGATPNRTLQLMVLQPGAGTVYTAVQKDIVRTVTANVLNTFKVRIPMESGQVLGLFVPHQQTGVFSSCAFGTVPSDRERTSLTLGEPALGAPVDYNDERGGSRLNVAAVLEPDADRDGFGDESQDGCPTSAATQRACSSAKKCKKKHRSAQAAKKKRKKCKKHKKK